MILKYRIDEGAAFTKEIKLTEDNPNYITLLGDRPDNPFYGGVIFVASLEEGTVLCSVFGMTSEGFFSDGQVNITQILSQGLGINDVTINRTKSTVTILEVDITLEGQENRMFAPVELPVDISTCCHVSANAEILS